jgi:hypothetical protein
MEADGFDLLNSTNYHHGLRMASARIIGLCKSIESAALTGYMALQYINL